MTRPGAHPVRLNGREVELLPDRAVFLPGEGALLIADLHLGKDETLRAAGMPIPPGASRADLDRLAALVAETEPERLVVLGDLLHARAGRSPETEAEFADFVRALPDRLRFILVRGNHDRGAGDPHPQLGIEVVEEPTDVGGIRLVHDPELHPPAPGRLTLAGHLHPAIRVGPRRKTACFWWRADTLILPAFSHFTGGARIDAVDGDRCWVPAEEAVLEVPPPRPRGRSRRP